MSRHLGCCSLFFLPHFLWSTVEFVVKSSQLSLESTSREATDFLNNLWEVIKQARQTGDFDIGRPQHHMDVPVLPLSAASSALGPWTLGALHRDISIGDLSIGDLSSGGHCCKVLSCSKRQDVSLDGASLKQSLSLPSSRLRHLLPNKFESGATEVALHALPGFKQPSIFLLRLQLCLQATKCQNSERIRSRAHAGQSDIARSKI